MHFEFLPQAFPTDRAKVAFMILHLTGRARAWATAEWSQGSPVCETLNEFKRALRRVFNPFSSVREKARELSNIRQGTDSVSDYAIRFRTLATDSGWNATALFDVFLDGLPGRIQDLLVPLDLPSDLDSLIALAIRIDHRLQERQGSRNRWSPAKDGRQRWVPTSTSQGGSASRLPAAVPGSKDSPGEEDEPMQLGHTRLSAEERRRRRQEGQCFYCSQQDHLLAACPAKGQVSRTSSSTSPLRVLTEVQIIHQDATVTLGSLVDAGADESLIDWGLAHQLNLRTERLPQPIAASALDGSPLFHITHENSRLIHDR